MPLDQSIMTMIMQLGVGGLGAVATIYMFRFLMTANSEFRQYLISENKRLQEENKQLRQALFSSRDPDAMRLATALLANAPKTDLTGYSLPPDKSF